MIDAWINANTCEVFDVSSFAWCEYVATLLLFLPFLSSTLNSFVPCFVVFGKLVKFGSVNLVDVALRALK